MRYPELVWAAAVGTAMAFPALWVFVFPVAVWKLIFWASHRFLLWLQDRNGLDTFEIQGYRFEWWLIRDGSTTIRQAYKSKTGNPHVIKKVIQCPECGHKVDDFFDHIAIDCSHDMSEEEISVLLRQQEERAGLKS